MTQKLIVFNYRYLSIINRAFSIMSTEVERRGSSRSSSATPTYTSPYEFTKTGLIGDQRDSMLQNELQYLVIF